MEVNYVELMINNMDLMLMENKEVVLVVKDNVKLLQDQKEIKDQMVIQVLQVDVGLQVFKENQVFRVYKDRLERKG